MKKETRELLKGYVKDCLNRGFGIEGIISHIEKRGFDKEEIDEIAQLAYHQDNNRFFVKALLFLIPFLMLVLINFIFELSIPLSIFIIVLSITVLAILAADRDTKRMLFLILIAFFASEIILIKYNVEIGIVLYSLFLAFSVLALIFRKFKLEAREALFIMIIIPLIRFLGSLLPLEGFSFPLRITVVYIMILITSFIILKNINLKDIMGKKWMGFLPLAFILGIFLGWIEYFILKPAPLFEQLSMSGFFLGILIMALTGFTEEFIFRGLLQNHFTKIFDVVPAILLSNLIFVGMHIIWLNLIELIFVFAIGLFCAVVYHKTKNLVLISLFHGAINLSLFVLSPLLI